MCNLKDKIEKLKSIFTNLIEAQINELNVNYHIELSVLENNFKAKNQTFENENTSLLKSLRR
jgi:hypothetical protein